MACSYFQITFNVIFPGSKMSLENKLIALERIYGLYDHYTGGLDLACKKFCSSCCTRNVTLTSLEAHKMFSHIEENNMTEAFIGRLESRSGLNRFQPLLTANGFAEYCVSGKEIPEEENDPSWGPCALLSDNACSFYAVRPFGCRCLVSGRNCGETGYAEIDDYTLTVNNVFLQFIEHLDRDGIFGNMTDMMLFLYEKKQGGAGRSIEKYGRTLLENRNVPVLMVPPEYHGRIAPLVNALQEIVSGI